MGVVESLRERFGRYKHYFWPVVGTLAVLFCGWMLYKEVRGLTWANLVDSFAAIPASGWALAVVATLFAYLALAEYDRIALIHLRRKIHWAFVMVTSFTTYSLSHNIGASLVSGTIIRFRAYGSRGLSPGEIGVLVGITTFTFLLGASLLGGVVLILRPEVLQRYFDVADWVAMVVGIVLLALIAFYLIGSLFHFRPLVIGRFHLNYPKPGVVLRQMVIGPLELLAAAAIIYFCLPAEGNPGFLTVAGIFVASFSLAIVSHAPGGLGVIEYVFLTGLDDMDQAQVLAALIVFRILYLLLPFAIALVVVMVFERSEFRRKTRERDMPTSPESLPPT
jgi:uncharacterized membrane protein YbhN (UPF0104 family)